MDQSRYLIKWLHTIMVCVASLGFCAGIATSAMAKDEPVKKDEPAKQSGSFLVKFKANVNDAKIQEVADYYGASKIMPLNNSESASHKDPDQWRKLRFESVDDLKDIARRIVQDNRVDETD